MLIYKKYNIEKFQFFEFHLEFPAIIFNTLPQDIYGENYNINKASFPTEISYARDRRSFYTFKFVILGFGFVVRNQWDY